MAAVDSPSGLVYSAFSRCPCGAGLAYVPSRTPDDGFWDCGDILLGRAVPRGQEGAVQHTAQLPFNFYKVVPETSPRADGQSTRPKP